MKSILYIIVYIVTVSDGEVRLDGSLTYIVWKNRLLNVVVVDDDA